MLDIFLTVMFCLFLYLFFYSLFLAFMDMDFDNTDNTTLLVGFCIWPVIVAVFLLLFLVQSVTVVTKYTVRLFGKIKNKLHIC